MIKRLFPLFLLAASVAPMVGCASTVPHELADARVAYQKAQGSSASQMAPADLQTAKESLDKAELAMVQAQLVTAARDKEQAQKGLLDTATMTAEQRNAQLQQSNQNLQRTSQQLDQERTARAEAEKRLKDAMARLNAFAAIKEEPRGMVITLPGGVLFESGKFALLGTAQEKLNQVADALLQNRDATMVVEGHTDSQGDPKMNQKLSEDRAKSVRDYLVTRGIAADRITSTGLGQDRPVADNKSAEGRANNRRVEIVVNGGNKGPTSKAAGL